ncbi:hypothetical protein A2738_01655 [Candidatus Nomurabacteria bacterium RIFCSPHIGHO2_01_FULL_42_15]|uniref:Uncharacterized protein n=1 Tax=Candidatus Nomurabacteria bacterium RIFCSPHIGHO2_01_FULL_42_15 TaxID=1801742 RepID=A0A1F6VG78_9BACT|nr:MAG: hypothetical protein A2738_01655 [Candidatus Nomurabacteria bacterium RIFCSPHIGHO2_01_FULL_42_15]OGI93008.1 MAG: hypothetical protein A3A99_00515 [Candidatus Nomurabacteria bacterium RIFCSPLOWO2_01_FULL_41_18]
MQNNNIKIPGRGWSAYGGKNKNGGFLQLIIIIIVVLFLMRYFGVTFSGILSFFNLTWVEIINWLKDAWEWFLDLFNSVK